MRYIDKLISDLAKTIEECARLRGELVEKDAARDEVQAALDIRNEAFRASVEDDNRRREVLTAKAEAMARALGVLCCATCDHAIGGSAGLMCTTCRAARTALAVWRGRKL
mgnify:CR=1 FL=1